MTPNTIYSAFKEMVNSHPHSPAVITDEATVSFLELDRLVNAIVAKIHPAQHEFIGIVMHHGLMQIAAMLAVLKSGAAYVPAEPSLPQDRIRYMMHNAGVKLVITDYLCLNLNPVDEDFPDLSKPDGEA